MRYADAGGVRTACGHKDLGPMTRWSSQVGGVIAGHAGDPATALTCGRGKSTVTADYVQYGNVLRAPAELDRKPDMLHLFSQPRTAGFLTRAAGVPAAP
jgi:hypothetical protein